MLRGFGMALDERRLEPALELVPIRQPGQRIMPGSERQLFSQQALFRDITHHHNHTNHLTVADHQWLAGDVGEHPPVVGMLDVVLVTVKLDRCLRLQRLADRVLGALLTLDTTEFEQGLNRHV